MGLAASQARLLLLTARKSDLEYRAQMISQSKLRLAMETEGIARNYTKALNDTCLTFDKIVDVNTGTKAQSVLTYEDFCSEANATGTYRIVEAATGKVVYINENEVTRYINPDSPTYKTVTGSGTAEDPYEFGDFHDPGQATNEDGTPKTDANGNPVKNPTKYDQDCATYLNNNMVKYEGLNNTDYFQQLLQSGVLIIEKCETSNTPVTGENGQELVNNPTANEQVRLTYQNYKWSSVSLNELSDVSTTYNTQNDAQAEAEYQYQSLRVQSKDKQLDVELKQIETQQKACESELESVKKVIQKNVETSFKYFS